ncbi:hypothetical protein NOCARDAX2BIS_140120 [Nocardioides sp. AX2bis]|nr:hypothetical protein NOCARDAX2BIS_140120 [Nocardioides sp. AX2bis]
MRSGASCTGQRYAVAAGTRTHCWHRGWDAVMGSGPPSLILGHTGAAPAPHPGGGRGHAVGLGGACSCACTQIGTCWVGPARGPTARGKALSTPHALARIARVVTGGLSLGVKGSQVQILSARHSFTRSEALSSA